MSKAIWICENKIRGIWYASSVVGPHKEKIAAEILLFQVLQEYEEETHSKINRKNFRFRKYVPAKRKGVKL